MHFSDIKGDKIKLKRKKFKINANYTWCSQAVTHPSTNHAQRCLTAVIKREPVFTSWYGSWQQSNINSLKYVLYFFMQHITIIILSIYFSKHKLVHFIFLIIWIQSSQIFWIKHKVTAIGDDSQLLIFSNSFSEEKSRM